MWTRSRATPLRASTEWPSRSLSDGQNRRQHAGNLLATQAPTVRPPVLARRRRCARPVLGATRTRLPGLRAAGMCGRCPLSHRYTMRDILARLRDGDVHPGDLDLLRTLAENVEESAWCGVANTIRDPCWAYSNWEQRTSPGTPAARPVPHHHCSLDGRTLPFHLPGRDRLPHVPLQAGEYMPHLATATVRRDNPLRGSSAAHASSLRDQLHPHPSRCAHRHQCRQALGSRPRRGPRLTWTPTGGWGTDRSRYCRPGTTRRQCHRSCAGRPTPDDPPLPPPPPELHSPLPLYAAPPTRGCNRCRTRGPLPPTTWPAPASPR